MSTDVDKFVEEQLHLLKLEHEAEVNESRNFIGHVPFKELVQKGVCINKLSISEVKSGLFGRTIIVFEARIQSTSKESSKQLVTNKITSGDIVSFGFGDDREIINSSGVVISIKKNFISVAFEHEIESIGQYKDSNKLFLIKTANDVTHRRLKAAVSVLKSNNLKSSELVDVLFGKQELRSVGNIPIEQVFFNKSLNHFQKEAVSFSLDTKNKVSIIHGPPGTGKTTTVIEIILQAVIQQGLKVLVVAPSNVAVDNILEKLVEYKSKNKSNPLSFVRLGHPVRAADQLQQYSLDSLVSNSDQKELIKDIQSELDSIKDKSNYHNRSNVKTLFNELRERERRAVIEVLTKSKVVLSTLTSSSPEGPLKYLLKSKDADGKLVTNDKPPFDVLIIDECSQAMEASCWIPIPLVSNKLILAGDHQQLPPTIISHEAAEKGLEVTLMERLIKTVSEKNRDNLLRMLNIQYRMNEKIMKWSSERFYEGKLLAHESVANHSLIDLVTEQSDDQEASFKDVLVLIDTAGCDMRELDVEDEESKGNEYEADLVVKYIQTLIETTGIDHSLIGVITPYNLQVELISSRLSFLELHGIEVRSVDGFQGREKEIIVISLVRSNEEHTIGFLSESRRINVAVTRAKRHLVLVCDSETVSSDPCIKTLVDHFETVGDVRSALEFVSGDVDVCFRPSNLRFKDPKSNEEKSKTEKLIAQAISKPLKKPVIDPEKQEQKDQAREGDFEKKIKAFLQEGSENFFEFPPKLNSFERMLVHKLAEKYHLVHESVGEGIERRIVIRKENPPLKHEVEEGMTGSVLMDDKTKSETESGTDQEVEQEEAKKKPKKKKSKPMEKVEPDIFPKKTKPKVNDLLKKDKFKETLENATEDDFDSLIAAAEKANKTCNFVTCKSSTVTLGQFCSFCSRTFCLSHSLPEVHGCGDEVKKSVRKTMIRDGIIYPGSGVPSKKPNAVRRGHLERALNKKLEKMNLERKGNKSSENKDTKK